MARYNILPASDARNLATNETQINELLQSIEKSVIRAAEDGKLQVDISIPQKYDEHVLRCVRYQLSRAQYVAKVENNDTWGVCEISIEWSD